jgi:cephalosporin-C deacetylase-like acetyl esterase
MPLALHGEALGGGLAVIAAAQLAQMGNPPARLVISVPDLGDWRWRVSRYCGGPAGAVNAAVVAARRGGEKLAQTLVSFDAALHARSVECAVLCKLAERDDVVPAPAAAAVFNALPDGRKRRFVTRFGHYDGGLADARRHARFDRIAHSFLDSSGSPVELMRPHDGELEP